MKIIILFELRQIFTSVHTFLFPYIAYMRDDLCRIIRDYFQSFGKGCRIIRRAKALEEVYNYGIINAHVNVLSLISRALPRFQCYTEKN